MDMQQQAEELERIEARIESLKEEIAQAEADLQAITAERQLLEESEEYRLGLTVTAPLRKLRKLKKAVMRHVS